MVYYFWCWAVVSSFVYLSLVFMIVQNRQHGNNEHNNKLKLIKIVLK